MFDYKQKRIELTITMSAQDITYIHVTCYKQYITVFATTGLYWNYEDSFLCVCVCLRVRLDLPSWINA